MFGFRSGQSEPGSATTFQGKEGSARPTVKLQPEKWFWVRQLLYKTPRIHPRRLLRTREVKQGFLYINSKFVTAVYQ